MVFDEQAAKGKSLISALYKQIVGSGDAAGIQFGAYSLKHPATGKPHSILMIGSHKLYGPCDGKTCRSTLRERPFIMTQRYWIIECFEHHALQWVPRESFLNDLVQAKINHDANNPGLDGFAGGTKHFPMGGG